jgi:5-methylcytosine-specific restriction endonuclease McrA
MSRVLPPLPNETTTKSKSYEINTLLDWLNEGDRLIINNRYQRGEVGQYKPQFRTRLIESIIRGFPLPSLLVMQKKGQADELIDGQQRLRTIEAFINGNFAIDGTHLLMLDATSYDGIRYSEMDADHKDRIKRDYEMSVNYIDDSMPDWMVYVLINAGQNPLTAAELRKAMFAEYESYWLIDEFAKSPEWTRYFTQGALAREKGTEMLCRGIVSMLYGGIDSGQNAKVWLESGLNEMFQSLSLAEVETLMSDVKKTMKLSREILGENPFRRNNLFSGRVTKVSKTMIEPVTYVFSNLRKKYSNAKLIEKQTELVSAWDEFMSFENDGAERYLGGNTPQKLVPRNRDVLEIMESVMVGSRKRRGSESSIPLELRIQVLEQHRKDNATIDCAICSNQLKDEITIDHIVSVEEGGETILENLQPAHRACNSSKHSRSVTRVFAAEEE